MSRLRSSLAFSFAGQYSTLLIQFASSLVLARLLSPQEIGIFSVGSVFMSLAHTLRDFGVTNYIIQERHLNRERIATAQGITLAIGWSLAIITFLLSRPLANFYAEPGVQKTILVLAVNFALLPFGSVTAALLRRDLRFDALYRINTVSASVQAFTSVGLAYLGFGFMSLAWGGLASALTVTLMTLFWRQHDQSWIPSLREWRRVLAKGAQFSGSSLLYELGTGGPSLITGRTLDFEAVGLLSRASGAVQLIYRGLVEAIFPVAAPYLAEQVRANRDLAQPYLHGLSLLSGIALPAFATLAVGARPIIELLYGPTWLLAVEPARILCLGSAMLSIAAICGSVTTAMGEAGVVLRLQAIYQPVKLLLVILLASGGLQAIAIAISIGESILAVAFFRSVGRLIQIPWSRTVGTLGTSTLIAVTTAGGGAIAAHLFDRTSPAIEALAVCFGSGLSWGLMIALVRHPLAAHFSRTIARFSTKTQPR